jgi:hypothetical protein
MYPTRLRSFRYIMSPLGSTVLLPPREVINAAGDYAFIAGGSTALLVRRAGAPALVRVVQTGDQAPGVPHSLMDIVAGLKINQSGLIFPRRGATGGIETIALEGQTAQGTSYAFSTFPGTLNSRPGEFFALDPAGAMLVSGTLKVGDHFVQGLWRYRSGALEKLAMGAH